MTQQTHLTLKTMPGPTFAWLWKEILKLLIETNRKRKKLSISFSTLIPIPIPISMYHVHSAVHLTINLVSCVWFSKPNFIFLNFLPSKNHLWSEYKGSSLLKALYCILVFLYSEQQEAEEKTWGRLALVTERLKVTFGVQDSWADSRDSPS